MTCRAPEIRVEERIDKIATQYRESWKFLGLIRNYLGKTAEATDVACRMLDYFDIDTAVGDQLTILGKALGWPRCHCRGQKRPVFGFECDDECGPPVVPIRGFCEADWDCGDGPEYVDFCFDDDELYRKFLKARIITLTGDYTHKGLTAAAREVFGPNAVIYREAFGTVAIATGRLLTHTEIAIAHLYEQALPVPPGVSLEIWHGDGPAFGFGDGWGGFCDGAFPIEITIH